jgi:hypothetical protein
LDGSNYRGDGKGACHHSDIKDFVDSDEKLAFRKHRGHILNVNYSFSSQLADKQLPGISLQFSADS